MHELTGRANTGAKTVPLLNLNNTTDLFPRVSYQLSSFRQETRMLLPRSERKKKKSCNKNSMKNTEMLENILSIYTKNVYVHVYIYSNISVFFIEFFFIEQLITDNALACAQALSMFQSIQNVYYCPFRPLAVYKS